LIGVKVSTVTLIQGPSIEEIAEEILPQVMPGDDVAATRPVQPEPSARVWAASVPSEDVSPPEQVVLQREDGARHWPIASDATLGEEGRPIVSRAKAHPAGWLVIVGARAAPRLRLFCFPFAGGGSAVYRTWAQFIDQAIEVVAIEPPGRLGRITETPVADMKQFVEQLVPAMQELLDRPFAFFGHCLGALTMYETARHLIRTTPARPSHLFVSGSRPPDRIADQGGFEQRVMHDLLKLAEFRIAMLAESDAQGTDFMPVGTHLGVLL